MVEGSDKAVIVATTRPETILGDTALCVNPNDPRYGWLPAGARVIVPLVNRAIPVIRDEYVDIEFGTGALKVTPAHDVNIRLGTHFVSTMERMKCFIFCCRTANSGWTSINSTVSVLMA